MYASVLDFEGKRAVELGTAAVWRGWVVLIGPDGHRPMMPTLKRNLKMHEPLHRKALKHSVFYLKSPQQIALNSPFDFVLTLLAPVDWPSDTWSVDPGDARLVGRSVGRSATSSLITGKNFVKLQSDSLSDTWSTSS
ncbi:hypothetical protein CR513_17613, partial [Mucuna pruriens]